MKKRVVAKGGQVFEVDTSDEACDKFGFKHGDRVNHPCVGLGTVEGVAPATEGLNPEPDVLWYTVDATGKVEYAYPSLSKAT